MYIAKKTGTTEKGSRYTILQDTPTSFHVSVQTGDFVIYEQFESPPSMEFLEKGILTLEEELLTTSTQNKIS